MAKTFLQIEALNENLLNLIPDYKYTVNLFNMQYKTMIASAHREMNSMEKNYNARMISRIGFVAQDMKDFEQEVADAILARAIDINNPGAECLVEARNNLQTSVNVAGDVIIQAANQTTAELQVINDSIFYPTVEVLEFAISQLDVEIFNAFAYFNPVVSMIQLILTLESEVRGWGALFEYFVSELFVDMIIFEMLTDTTTRDVFLQLDAGLNDFRASGNAIRNSLSTCV